MTNEWLGQFKYIGRQSDEKIQSWDNVPTIIDDWAFTDEGFTIPDDGETVMDINWEWLYGKLSPGTCRITKSVIDSNKNYPNVNIPLYMLVSQFVIAG